MTILVKRGVHRSRATMTKLLVALDRAYRFYATTTGHVPERVNSLHGRDEIAEVSSTCGAGCTYPGATGTEIETPYLDRLYHQASRNDRYDQVLFYELGRSFWFWDSKLKFRRPQKDPVVTGFAVLMRFESMAASGLAGAPFEGTRFTTFQAQVTALAHKYENDPSLTFALTLGARQVARDVRGHGFLGIAHDAAREKTRRGTVRTPVLAQGGPSPDYLVNHRSRNELGSRCGPRRMRKPPSGLLQALGIPSTERQDHRASRGEARARAERELRVGQAPRRRRLQLRALISATTSQRSTEARVPGASPGSIARSSDDTPSATLWPAWPSLLPPRRTCWR